MPQEVQKRRPGRPRRRTFYNRIGFHITSDLHQQMQEIASGRKALLEEVYGEAVSCFLEARASEPTSYVKPPVRPLAKRLMIEMQEPLCRAIRHAAVDDHCRVSDVFETAVRLYLTKCLHKYD